MGSSITIDKSLTIIGVGFHPDSTISSTFEVIQNTNNVYGIAPSALFQTIAGTTFSFVNNYHLASGSPAIGAGYGVTDCGIYGGPNPWKDGRCCAAQPAHQLPIHWQHN